MKIIAISQRVDEIKDYGEIRDALDENWQKLFLQLDAAVLPIPNESRILQAALERIRPDAIVLSGGNHPQVYGGTAPERDRIDEGLIQYAIKNGIPLLGVCRGMQSIAMYFGGSLKKTTGHVAVWHEIEGGITREVNSYHSYAVDDPGDGITVVSRTKDGVAEAICHEEYPVYGIMWHPERVKGFDEADLLFIKEKLRL